MQRNSIYNNNSNYNKCIVVAGALFALLLLCDLARATPMMYKKNPQDKYEADLVAVSSTVIPLTVLEVSYGLGGKPSEEYKMAYLKKLRKKVQHAGGAGTAQSAAQQGEVNMGAYPDTLITIKNKNQHDAANKAKVKGI